jgi:adenine-specific DNA-methyltransferase
MDLDHPYLKSQLIAYIGNKRALLSFIADFFRKLEEEHSITRFLDPFAGSGSVSRLAKFLGYEVRSNDWEPYTEIINGCHIGIDKRDTAPLFRRFGGIESAFAFFQGFPGRGGNEERLEPYISRYYAPKDTASADYRTERLFYTRENGLFIDRVREGIEREYPGWDLPDGDRKEKLLLVASLIYQAATHANTSGVFKAFHKGFGGHGRDALRRITAPMELLLPVLYDGKGECTVSACDAEEFLSGYTADLCYIDPPYNQHQYGSNYHMLNTIAKWDKPVYPLVRGKDGRLLNKGGIRTDWTETRSDFCYRDRAPEAFRRLLDAVDARFIVVSYNTEGIICFDELVDLLAAVGKVELFSNEYITFRGGRQSINRRTHNAELLLLCTRRKKSDPASRERIDRFKDETKCKNLLRGGFHPGRIRRAFTVIDDRVSFLGEGGPYLQTDCLVYFHTPVPSGLLAPLTSAELAGIRHSLEICMFNDRKEECDVLLELLRNGIPGEMTVKIAKKLLQALKKIAHKKYRRDYEEVFENTRRLAREKIDNFWDFSAELDRLEEVASLRFNG